MQHRRGSRFPQLQIQIQHCRIGLALRDSWEFGLEGATESQTGEIDWDMKRVGGNSKKSTVYWLWPSLVRCWKKRRLSKVDFDFSEPQQLPRRSCA